MRDNCIVVVIMRRRALFDKDADEVEDFCFTAYRDHITKAVF